MIAISSGDCSFLANSADEVLLRPLGDEFVDVLVTGFYQSYGYLLNEKYWLNQYISTKKKFPPKNEKLRVSSLERYT